MQDYCSIVDNRNYGNAAKEIGYQLGLEIGRGAVNKSARKRQEISLDSVIEELDLLWKRSELGALGWYNKRLNLLRVGCKVICDMRDQSRKEDCMAFSFNGGLLEGLLQSSLGRKFRVSLAGQVGTGINVGTNSYCVLQIYEIRPICEVFEEQKPATEAVPKEDIEARLPRIWSLLRA